MHMPHQIEVQFAFRNALLDCFLEIEGYVVVELVLKDAVARVEEVFEIVTMRELISRALVGNVKVRLLFKSSILSLLFGCRVTVRRCERLLDEPHQLYI